MIEDECGAPEYFTGGSRLCPVDGALGTHRPGQPRARRSPAIRPRSLHSGRPMAVSITQSTEIGTVYGLDEIAAISAICRRRGLPLHMDGARFANALVSLDTTPAEMTWKRGVDIVSFGGTKNGCWCAEAIVLFDRDQGRARWPSSASAPRSSSRSRASSRRSSTPISRTGCGWRRRATPMRMAAQAGRPHPRIEDVRLAWEPQANEVFAVMTSNEKDRLLKRGRHVLRLAHAARSTRDKLAAGEGICRFVTSFATTADDVDAFGDLIG